MGKKGGFSWSWKRALGLSGAKGKLSRQLGIPLTEQGRQRKVGSCLGCCILFIVPFGVIITTLLVSVILLSSCVTVPGL